MTQRAMQADDPAQIPLVTPAVQPGQAPSRLLETPEEARNRQVAQIAGAVGALARKVEAIDRPPVTMANRVASLERAREYATELGVPPGLDRLKTELAIARYLTGE